jgi:acyl dehydratase
MTRSIEVGASAPQRDYGPLGIADFVRYAGASGDFNPIHYDESFARSAGYPSIFSQGMHQAAVLASFVTDWLGAETVRRFQVRFREQVWPGDVLTCSASVIAAEVRDDGLFVTVEIAAVRQTGDIAVSGSADFLLPERP